MSVKETILTKTEIHADVQNRLFPLFLQLDEVNVLVAGGGQVACDKLRLLLKHASSALVTVIDAKLHEQIHLLADEYPGISIYERHLKDEDIKNCDIVFAAFEDDNANAELCITARNLLKLVNVAGQPELSNFYLPVVPHASSLTARHSRKNGQLQNGTALPTNDLPEQLRTLVEGVNGASPATARQLEVLTEELARIAHQNREKEKRSQVHWTKISTYSVLAFALMIIGHVIFSYISVPLIWQTTADFYNTLDRNFHWMVLAGFVAQLVDGALGMGYGVTSASILLSTGISPAAISGSIHTAEMFASGASGYSHYRFGNVNKKLFRILVIPGIVGAIAGAFLLVFLGEKYAAYVRPIMAAYTLLLGFRILLNAYHQMKQPKKFRRYGMLAGIGGFLDSFGGGGWGPIVTTTLITKGRSPRFVIGTVSLTEFFVTLSSAFSFFILLGVTHLQAIVALIIGGLLAAPLAAKLVGRLPRKISLTLLGILVIIWSCKILLTLL